MTTEYECKKIFKQRLRHLTATKCSKRMCSIKVVHLNDNKMQKFHNRDCFDNLTGFDFCN